jgi:amino acid permease
MVSEIMLNEVRLTNERLRISIFILLFWVIITTLDFTGAINFGDNDIGFVTYAIIASTAIIILLLSLGIQIEPLVKGMIRNRKDIDKFWESQKELKPDIKKRTLASEIMLIIAILLMLTSLLFIVI